MLRYLKRLQLRDSRSTNGVEYFVMSDLSRNLHCQIMGISEIVWGISRWFPWMFPNTGWLLSISLWDRDKETCHIVETSFLTYRKEGHCCFYCKELKSRLAHFFPANPVQNTLCILFASWMQLMKICCKFTLFLLYIQPAFRWINFFHEQRTC